MRPASRPRRQAEVERAPARFLRRYGVFDWIWSRTRRKCGQAVLGRSRMGGGIVEAPVDPVRVREHGTLLLCVVTYGNHVVEGLAEEFIHMFGALAAYVDIQVAKRFDRFGADTRGRRARAVHFQPISGHMGAVLRRSGCERSFPHRG